MFELLSNKLETNPRTIIARLTSTDVIDDICMLKEDEGCCIAQVADFCKQKVILYVLGYKHKLFETTKSEIPSNLMFMCASNHMYPVIDEERRETIFKPSSNIGGKMNKHRAQQKVEHKINITNT